MKIPIHGNTLVLGQALEWPIYDHCDSLLLRVGNFVGSNKQVGLLIDREAYLLIEVPKEPNKPSSNPFLIINRLVSQLALTYDAIINRKGDVGYKLYECAQTIVKMTAADLDASMGAVHLYRDHTSTLLKPIFSAILADAVAGYLKYERNERINLVMAALSCNVALVAYQSKFDRQKTPLSKKQNELVSQHSEKSAELLAAGGITDNTILRIVEQHHERLDGTGYPHHLDGEQISEGAQIVSLCEYYSAVTGVREYKPSLHPREVLCTLHNDTTRAHQDLRLAFIKTLGAYPCGSFVRLVNDEIAVVIKNRGFVSQPIVKSIENKEGSLYELPVERDCVERQYLIKETYYPKTNRDMDLPYLWDYL